MNKYERLQRKRSIFWYFLVECIALTIQPRRAATVMWSIRWTFDDYSKFTREVPLFLEMLLLPEFSYKELWGTMEGSLHARNQLDRPVVLIQYWRYRTIDPDWIQGNSSLVKEWSMDETVFRQKSLTRIQLTASRTPTTATTSKIRTTEADQLPVHQPTNTSN